MNTQEYLLTQLAEECCEVAQICSKSNRFGLDDVYNHKEQGPGSNRDKLKVELNDLLAVLELLDERKLFHFNGNSEMIKAKKLKILKYMEVAWSKKTLDEIVISNPITQCPHCKMPTNSTEHKQLCEFKPS